MIIAATGKYFFINTFMGNFHLPWCFHFVVKFFCFFLVRTLLLSRFIFLIFCVFKVSLFSLNNSIQSIVSVFCYKKYCLIFSTFFYRFAIIL